MKNTCILTYVSYNHLYVSNAFDYIPISEENKAVAMAIIEPFSSYACLKVLVSKSVNQSISRKCWIRILH